MMSDEWYSVSLSFGGGNVNVKNECELFWKDSIVYDAVNRKSVRDRKKTMMAHVDARE